MIPPLEVVRVLNAASIAFVLVGAHGAVGWMNEARATEDVDVLVAARHHKRALRALHAAFPHLEVIQLPVVTRLKDPESQKVVIDLMKPNQELHRVIFKNTHTVRAEGQTYRIPSLEMAIAMKFAPMIRANRADEDKMQDAHDFIRMVKNNPDFKRDKLRELGNLVYPGAGVEVLELARKAQAGEKLSL